jgi:hypothetical protein
VKESTTSFWPRGLLAGALLATCLIVPAFVVMLFDAAVGATRLHPDANGRFTLFQRPIQLHARGAFFGGRITLQAVLAQRFALLPAADPAEPQGRPANAAFEPSPLPEVARSSLLRLQLENVSTENLEVEILRVDSMLGKFVARPDRLMLAPHQTANIDSLVAEQKISTGSIPMKVGLRLAGQVETRSLVLNDHALARLGH